MIEYKLRPVTRYIVTRYEGPGPGEGFDVASKMSCGSSQVGEYDNEEVAYAVGYAMAKAEADRLGFGPGDERMKYPERAQFGQIGGKTSDRFPLRQAGSLSDAGYDRLPESERFATSAGM